MLLQTVIIVTFLVSLIEAWHPYDHSKELPETCKDFDYNTSYAKVDHDFISKYKMWPNLMTKQKLARGETMFGFVEAMEAVWKNQHPADCKTAKYLISPHYDQGFACEFHYLGVGLAAAMALGRVYIYPKVHTKLNTVYGWVVNNTFCKDQGKDTIECYYEPWTHCTWEDAIGSEIFVAETNTLINSPFVTSSSIFNNLANFDNSRHALVLRQVATYNVVPPQFLPSLQCSPFLPKHYQYWWRSVAVAFMLRPNAATLSFISQHENDKTLMGFNQDTDQCVSVHIRRGGKHIEMKIIEDVSIFLETAKVLWNNLQVKQQQQQHHQQPKKPFIFVGTEDPSALASAIEWGSRNNWNVMYTDLFDRGSVSTRLDWHTQDHMKKTNTQVHHELEYLSMLLNIDHHLQCSAFVCTHGSNWCRMLDEMRATVVNKADAQFAEMGCVLDAARGNAPCIDKLILNDKVGY